MNNPFEIITYLLSQKKMTAPEKRLMRDAVISYVTTHPVKTGIMSPYTFRFFTTALASLVLVVGGAFGITRASMQALPFETLYPVKLWIEEFQSNNQSTIESKIAFETKRIETRFEEAATLAVQQSLDESRALLVQSGIEYSQSKVKTLAIDLESQQPALALDVASNLESTLSSSGKLLARIENATGQSIRPIVLAAQVSTERIALEKVNLEKIVALQPDSLNQATTLERFENLKKTTSDQEILKEVQVLIDQSKFSEALIAIQKVEQKIQETTRTKEFELEFALPALPEIPVVETPVVPEPSAETPGAEPTTPVTDPANPIQVPVKLEPTAETPVSGTSTQLPIIG